MKSKKPVVWINIFTVKPGKLNELIAIQSEDLNHFKKKNIPGWISSRLYALNDGNKAIMVSTFDSMEAHRNCLKREDFTEHRRKLEPLIERTDGQYYTLVEKIDNDDLN